VFFFNWLTTVNPLKQNKAHSHLFNIILKRSEHVFRKEKNSVMNLEILRKQEAKQKKKLKNRNFFKDDEGFSICKAHCSNTLRKF
jgi:hypothetical protein